MQQFDGWQYLPFNGWAPDGCDSNGKRYLRRLYLPFTTQIVAYHSCVCNELVSLLNRHLIKSSSSNKLIVERCFQRLRLLYPPVILTPFSYERILIHKKGSKKKLYKQALIKLLRRGVNSSDIMINMFVKYERMNLKDPLKPPRAIQARGAVYNLKLQRYIYAYSKWLTHTMDVRWRYATKGMDPYQLGAFLHQCWLTYCNPVAKLFDHDRFDSRTHRYWLRGMHSYINDHFEADLTKDLRTLESARCTTRHGVVYDTTDCVFSGDVTTSDGNSTINKALLVDLTWGLDTIDVDNGDDSVVFLDEKDLAELDSRDLKCYHYETKSSTVREFELIEYCQCHPVNTINGWLMVRDPQRVMSRATVCLDNNIDLFSWYASVGECEYSCNRGVPVLSSFAKMLMRASDKRVKLEPDFEYHRVKRDYCDDITDVARMSFQCAFGYDISLQLSMEYYFDNFKWDLETRNVANPTLPTMTIP